MKRRLFITLGAGALAAGSAAGSLAGAESLKPTSPAEDARAALPDAARVRVNEAGHTYGSAVDAARPEDEPDLILVMATNGREGYVWKKDLDDPTPANPDDAARRGKPAQRTIKVYASDGTTVVGDFVVN